MHRDLHADSSPSTLFCYVVHLKSKTNTTSWLAQVLSKWPPTLTYGELNNTEILCHHHSHKLLSPMLNVGLITNCRQILSFRQPISLTNFRVYRVFNFLCPASCWLSLISFCRNVPYIIVISQPLWWLKGSTKYNISISKTGCCDWAILLRFSDII